MSSERSTPASGSSGDGGRDPRGARSVAEGRAAPTAAVLRTKLRLQDLEIAGRTVLVRADLNVPIENGAVTDDTRIMGTVPTLRYLQRAGARVVVMSHRGRPGGERNAELSLQPIATVLADRLDTHVEFVPDCVGPRVKTAVHDVEPGRVLLLENLRFHAGETANDGDFAAALADLADAYVNDAFGASHREHASIARVPLTVAEAAAGDLLHREVNMLSRVLVQPQPPFALVLGGAKVSDKVAIIGNLLPLIDRMLIGGAMANAFLAAQGREMGASLAPKEAIAQASEVLASAEVADVEVVLPEDLVVAPSIGQPDRAHVVLQVPPDEMALDLGPETRGRFAAAVSGARTVVWNGPMGVFETSEFAEGTRSMAESIAALAPGAFTVIGGGDTAAAAAKFSISNHVSHVSTGGGASLDLLSGRILPGISALTDREMYGGDVG
ncbi:MAG TPA: phosphoglycerate kinase [Acidobacteriota bacterium]|nr:phosphoglycerate kinase [Acidobacteriota bacterium]